MAGPITIRVTRASESLAAIFAERHGAQKDVSVAAGVNQSRLSRLARGLLVPRLDEALRLEKHCNIAVGDWEVGIEEATDAAE